MQNAIQKLQTSMDHIFIVCWVSSILFLFEYLMFENEQVDNPNVVMFLTKMGEIIPGRA